MSYAGTSTKPKIGRLRVMATHSLFLMVRIVFADNEVLSTIFSNMISDWLYIYHRKFQLEVVNQFLFRPSNNIYM